MRDFDADLMAILKTETEYEKKLKTDPAYNKKFKEELAENSGNAGIFAELKNPVTIARKARYVDGVAHRSYLVDFQYVVSGEMRVKVLGKEITLRKGDIFIPNQYTVFSHQALGEDDIVLSFIIKSDFFEDMCTRLYTSNLLREFMLDSLRPEASWNHYLLFNNVDDLVIFNLIESMAFAAFPYMNDETLRAGVDPTPEITYQMMTIVFSILSNEMDKLSENSNISYTEVIRRTTSSYLDRQYKTATLGELAEMLNQSEASMSRLIKKIYGVTFKDLLLQKRFDQAVRLLECTDLPVAEVALAVGYENTSFFYRRFKEIYKVSPKEYRTRDK